MVSAESPTIGRPRRQHPVSGRHLSDLVASSLTVNSETDPAIDATFWERYHFTRILYVDYPSVQQKTGFSCEHLSAS